MRILTLVIAGLCFSALAQDEATTPFQDQAAPPLTVRTEKEVAPVPEGTSWMQEYTVGAGDVFNIELYGKPETKRLLIPIQPDGTVTYLQAQNVNVTGLTIEGMRDAIQKVLNEHFKNIEVIIQPVTLQSKRFFVLGRVVQKGSFVLDHPTTIVEAVAAARGFESGLLEPTTAGIADLSRSFVVRNGEKLSVNLEKLFLEGDFSQNAYIEPNDYIYFASAESKEVYVLGAVLRPGKLDYLPGATVMAALASAGSFRPEAWRDAVLVVRGSLNNPETIEVDCNDILKGRAKDVKLEPHDIIYVSTRPWRIAEDLLDQASRAFVNSVVTTWVRPNIIINRRDVLPEFNAPASGD